MLSLTSTSICVFLLAVTPTLAAHPPLHARFGHISDDFLMLSKRQEGYQPTQRRCGPGDTCAVSCGAEYETCPSTDGNLHCYDPTILKQNCCTDGTGNACRQGFFCTSDSQSRTWCCPDGLDLVSCARSYGLTDTLRAEIPAPTGAVSGTGSVPGTNYPTTTPTYPYPNATYTYGPTDVTGTGSVPAVTETGGPEPTGDNGTPCTTGCGEATTAVNGPANGTATNTPSQVTSLTPQFTGQASTNSALASAWFCILATALGFAVVL